MSGKVISIVFSQLNIKIPITESSIMDGMAAETKHVNEKIAFLCGRAGVTASQLSHIAGVTRAAAGQYFETTLPAATSLKRIADHFGVSLDWLMAETEPTDSPKPSTLDDESLALEAARRYAQAESRLLCILEAAESIDWSNVGKVLEMVEAIDKAPDEVRKNVAVASSLFVIVRSTLDRFDSVKIARETGVLEAIIGDGDHDRRKYFVDRIDALYQLMTPTDNARTVFMCALQDSMWVMDDPDYAFGLAEEALADAGVKIESVDERSDRLKRERHDRQAAAIDAGSPRARKRKD